MRERLPNRCKAESLDFEHAGRKWTLTVSRFDDGRIAEIFLNAEKDSAVAQLAQESAIVTSIALQFGCDIETLRHAVAGTGAGPLSAALELLDGGAR